MQPRRKAQRQNSCGPYDQQQQQQQKHHQQQTNNNNKKHHKRKYELLKTTNQHMNQSARTFRETKSNKIKPPKMQTTNWIKILQ